MLTFREERMNGHFTKYHVEGLPFPLVLHHFTAADGPDADFHDHPFGFMSFIFRGGYREEMLGMLPGIEGQIH